MLTSRCSFLLPVIFLTFSSTLCSFCETRGNVDKKPQHVSGSAGKKIVAHAGGACMTEQSLMDEINFLYVEMKQLIISFLG